MSTKLHIKNINKSISYFELGNLFSRFGEIIYIDIINDIKSMKSKGSAFIEMADTKCAQKAIDALNKVIWMQNKVSVKLARKEEMSKVSNSLYFQI